ncbi:MAG: S-adenosyl-l-methionine hydroxide adenosyltransferase family protein [Bacteroidota bacterium]
MQLVTLTTDWGSGDPYVASFVGDLLRQDVSIRIEHISHDLPKDDLLSAAFFTISTFHHFPKGTVHFIGHEVAGGHQFNKASVYLIARFQEHFFVGADSGIFSMAFQGRNFECWKPEIPKGMHLRQLFEKLAETIVSLSRGKDPSTLGEPYTDLVQNHFTRPTSDPSGIRCSVLYIDSHGNAIFNLNRSVFEKERNGRPFTILVRKATYKIGRISNHYNEVETGDILALFNQNDFLEIALNKDNAAKLIGFKVYDSILIEFHDN